VRVFKVCDVHNRDEKLMVMEVLLNPPSRTKGKCCVKQVSVQYEVFGNDRMFREVKRLGEEVSKFNASL